jgi:hypothetical protein
VRPWLATTAVIVTTALLVTASVTITTADMLGRALGWLLLARPGRSQ